MFYQFRKDGIPCKGPHTGAGEKSEDEEAADDEVLWTDCNIRSWLREVEVGEQGEGVFSFFLVLTILFS